MCKAIEDMLNDVRKENAREMVTDTRLSHEDIARYSGLTLEEVKTLAGAKS